MGKAIFIDTETTDTEDPRPVEIAVSEVFEDPHRPLTRDGNAGLVFPLECTALRYNPLKKINFGAMAVHHITDAMVAIERPWTDFKLPEGTQYLIGHQVDFDWQALGSPPGIKRICTMALSRALWPTADAHTLGAMLYMLDTEFIQRFAGRTHGAAVDVLLCARLFEVIMATVTAADVHTMEDLWTWSEEARVPKIIGFGKHKGSTIADLPWSYREWIMKQEDMDQYLKIAVRKSMYHR